MIIILSLILIVLLALYWKLSILVDKLIDTPEASKLTLQAIKQSIMSKPTIIYPKSRTEHILEKRQKENEAKGLDTEIPFI